VSDCDGERAIRDVSWRGQVESRVKDLEADLDRARAGAEYEPVNGDIAKRNIDLAHKIAVDAPARFSLGWFRRWASGSDVEAAWSAIHDAEAALVMILAKETIHARLSDLRAEVTTILEGDGRVVDYVDDIRRFEAGGTNEIGTCERERIRVIESAIDSVSDAAHLNVRNYRNWLLIVSVVVSGGLIGVAVAHLLDSEVLFIGEGNPPGHIGADIGHLETAGAVGGLLMALFALIRLQVYSGPVALPLWQALVRIPAGAAAGVVGAAFMQGGLLSSIRAQDRSGLLAYAVLFGAAPEIVLRFLDKRVNEATAAARPTHDPLRTVPTQRTPAPTREGAKHSTSERSAPEASADATTDAPPESTSTAVVPGGAS
jgi:hypothetical protein